MTLTEFLLARIDEDEETAHGVVAAIQSNYGTESWDARPDGRLGLGGGLSLGVGPVAPHVARHDPAHVLAECEAKRRIVERAKQIDALPTEVWEGEGRGVEQGLEYALRSLAAVYVGHPDYDEAWRP